MLKLRHVTLSGDGEPTLCPNFVEAVHAVIHVRALGEFPFFKIVLITNATGLDLPQVQQGLRFFTAQDEIWAKLEAGTEAPLELLRRNRERLRPKRGKCRPDCELLAPHQIERAEAPRVIERDPPAFVGLDDEMVVLLDLGRVDPPSSRHAEVEDKGVAAVGSDQAIFRAASELRDPSAGQPLAEVHGERAPEIGPPRLDPCDPPTFQDPLQAAHGGLDFGKLGHRGAIWRTARKPARAARR